MESLELVHRDVSSAYYGMRERTLQAYALARNAAAALADGLATKAEARFRYVDQAEADLDKVDREVDSAVAPALISASPTEAHELLAEMKMVIDLERIGDLLASVAGNARTLGIRLDDEDAGELIRMSTILERMLIDAHGAFVASNVDRAVAVLRMDSEMDRRRNGLMIRHLEAPASSPHESLYALFMAQSLERAADHVKNLAEETCHLVRGYTVRHLPLQTDSPDEQMYFELLQSQPTPGPRGSHTDLWESKIPVLQSEGK